MRCRVVHRARCWTRLRQQSARARWCRSAGSRATTRCGSSGALTTRRTRCPTWRRRPTSTRTCCARASASPTYATLPLPLPILSYLVSRARSSEREDARPKDWDWSATVDSILLIDIATFSALLWRDRTCRVTASQPSLSTLATQKLRYCRLCRF